MVESFRGVPDVHIGLLAVSLNREAESAGLQTKRRCLAPLHTTRSARGREGRRRGSPRDPDVVIREASIAARQAFIDAWRDARSLNP